MFFKLSTTVYIEIKDNFFVYCNLTGQGNTEIPESNDIFQKIQQLNGKNILEPETINWFSHIQEISRNHVRDLGGEGQPLFTCFFGSSSDFLIIPPNEISITDNPLFFENYHKYNAMDVIKRMVDDNYNAAKILEKIKEIQNYPDYSFVIEKKLENNSRVFYYHHLDGSNIPYFYQKDTLYDMINPNTLNKLHELQEIYDEDDKHHENYVHSSSEIISKYIQNLYKEKGIDVDVNVKQSFHESFDNIYELCFITIGKPLESYIELNKEDLNQAIEQYIDKIEEKMEKKQSFKP